MKPPVVPITQTLQITSRVKIFNEIPEADQLEIKAIAQELGEVLQKLKDEGEAI